MSCFSCATEGIHWERMGPRNVEWEYLVGLRYTDNLEPLSHCLASGIRLHTPVSETSCLFPENPVIITSSEADALKKDAYSQDLAQSPLLPVDPQLGSTLSKFWGEQITQISVPQKGIDFQDEYSIQLYEMDFFYPLRYYFFSFNMLIN